MASILKSLRISQDVKAVIEEHARLVGVESRRFSSSQDDQDQALELIVSLNMHIPSDIKRDARSKLVITTSDHNSVNWYDPQKKKANASNPVKFERWRRVYQCMAGSDNTTGHHAGKRRDMSWKDVGCPFWIKLTSTHHGRKDDSMILTIDEIAGEFTHSAECLALTEMEINPQIPLHPELREYALSLLRIRVPLSQLKQLCRTWAEKKWEPWRENTVFPQAPARDNLHLWFRSDKPQPPDPRLSASCIAYTPHIIGETDRFTLVLTTPEQKILAWRYGHKRQVMMDLTFGICSGHVLLTILMAIDEQNHGVPIGAFLFSAKQEAKAVHADYNGPLLQRLLGEWKRGMGWNEAGEEFEITVGNTDNDTREQHALEGNWALILLLLCMFHVWQAWRNALTKHLRGIPQGEEREEVRQRLGKFLMRLLKEIDVYEDAIAEYNTELRYFKALAAKRTDIDKWKSKAGLAFLAYLQSYLKVREFWLSWSVAGVHEAASRLGVPISEIARTNNHLESFNGRIKGKFFAHHMRGGRLPRLDYWVLIYITEALPNFFAEWAEKRALATYYSRMRHAAPTCPPAHNFPLIILPPTNPAVPKPPPALPKPKTVAEACSQAAQWAEHVFAHPLPPQIERKAAEISTEQLLQDLQTDADTENSDPGDEEHVLTEGMEADVEELCLAADHQSVHQSCLADSSASMDYDSNLPPLPSDTSSCPSLSDVALDSSEIILQLDISPTDELDSSSSDDEPFDLARITREKIDPTKPAIDSRRTTVMMELQRQEDELVVTIKRLLGLGVSKDTLQKHISQSIAEQLFNEAPTELQPEVHHPPGIPSRGRSTSFPGICLPAPSSTNLQPRLAAFDPQMKHARYPTFGFR
ncbi:hypothetical protein MVEN_02390300 [Mycena venus]|uniref:Uncharacterized protein n=1 Tax=Mycena venus TaxID=2733690 RepID=A0A8H6X1U1_9AGAR|nr:hypothetical protein MVEN_02390300 [Mycena venus]